MLLAINYVIAITHVQRGFSSVAIEYFSQGDAKVGMNLPAAVRCRPRYPVDEAASNAGVHWVMPAVQRTPGGGGLCFWG